MTDSFLKSVLVVLLFSSCGPSSQRSGVQQTNQRSAATNRVYNFLSVYRTSVEDTVYTDSMTLKLVSDGQGRISGTYLWMLPGKDGKYGKVNGRLSDDTVYGIYAYYQEGSEYKDSIQILLQPNRAIITQFNAPGSQLVDTLPVWVK